MQTGKLVLRDIKPGRAYTKLVLRGTKQTQF